MTTLGSTHTPERPMTVEGWYRLSEHPRQFLSAVPDLDASTLVGLADRAITQPPWPTSPCSGKPASVGSGP